MYVTKVRFLNRVNLGNYQHEELECEVGSSPESGDCPHEMMAYARKVCTENTTAALAVKQSVNSGSITVATETVNLQDPMSPVVSESKSPPVSPPVSPPPPGYLQWKALLKVTAEKQGWEEVQRVFSIDEYKPFRVHLATIPEDMTWKEEWLKPTAQATSARLEGK